MTDWTPMQKEALSSSGNLLISASAGSGKTSVMAQKVTDYLFASQDAEIGRLVVITFTKAGAEEIKQKLSERLYEKLRETTDGPGRERIRKQLAGIASSDISTIDSFCNRIFKTYFELIDKDPLVSLMEPNEANLMFARARESVFEEDLRAEEPMFRALLLHFTAKRNIDRLRSALDYIHKFISVQESGAAFIENSLRELQTSLAASAAAMYLLRAFKKKAEALGTLCEQRFAAFGNLPAQKPITAEYLNALSVCFGVLRTVACAPDAENMHRILPLLEDVICPKLLTKGLDEVEATALKEAQTVINAVRKSFLPELEEAFGESFAAEAEEDKTVSKTASALLTLAKKVEERYAELKDKERKADFADIEHYAFQILYQHPQTADEIKNSVDRIFVDEYQDTNFLQEAIVSRIAKDNVFMVGDVKQSIYKFRFAEPSIFLGKLKRFSDTGEGKNLSFNENFRSSPGVIKFVNAVFDEIMTGDFGGIDYRADAELRFGFKEAPEKKNGFPDAEVAVFDKDTGDAGSYPPVYDVLSSPRRADNPSPEAVYIAERISSMVGKALIFDARTKTHRLCRYADIAVLCRVNEASHITQELAFRKIPYSAEGFRGETDCSSTDLLIAFARLLDNPRQDLPLASLMLSFLGKFSDAEMLEIRSKSRYIWFWEAVNAYSGVPNIENKIKSFFGLLQKYRQLSAFLDMRELFDRLLAETGYDGYLLSLPDQNAIRRLNAYIYALSGSRKGSGLSEYIASLGAADEFSFASADDDCVTFLSIHRSKGLEFPIVFLPKAEYGRNVYRNSGGLVFLDSALGASLKRLDSERKTRDTFRIRAMNKKALAEDKEERVRLLYVAMTRAKQHLFISMTADKPLEFGDAVKQNKYLTPDEPGNFMGWLEFAFLRNPELRTYLAEESPALTRICEERAQYLPKQAAPVLLTKPYPFAVSAELSFKYSVSTLNKRSEPVIPDDLPLAETIDFDREEAEDKIALGTAYHTVLQYADFGRTSPAYADELIGELLADGRLPALPEGFDKGAVCKALANPVFSELHKGTCYREQPFMLYVPASLVKDTQSEDKILVQGVIDFLSVGEKSVLVDYKFTGAPAEIVTDRYRRQLDIYTLAAEKALGIRLVRRAIYLIGKDEFVWM